MRNVICLLACLSAGWAGTISSGGFGNVSTSIVYPAATNLDVNVEESSLSRIDLGGYSFSFLIAFTYNGSYDLLVGGNAPSSSNIGSVVINGVTYVAGPNLSIEVLMTFSSASPDAPWYSCGDTLNPIGCRQALDVPFTMTGSVVVRSQQLVWVYDSNGYPLYQVLQWGTLLSDTLNGQGKMDSVQRSPSVGPNEYISGVYNFAPVPEPATIIPVGVGLGILLLSGVRLKNSYSRR